MQFQEAILTLKVGFEVKKMEKQLQQDLPKAQHTKIKILWILNSSIVWGKEEVINRQNKNKFENPSMCQKYNACPYKLVLTADY